MRGLAKKVEQSHQTLEWELTDQELGGFLVLANFAQGHGTRTVPMRFLHTTWEEFGLRDAMKSSFSTSGWGTLTGCFRGQLLSGSFSTGGLACCLLSAGHFFFVRQASSSWNTKTV